MKIVLKRRHIHKRIAKEHLLVYWAALTVHYIVGVFNNRNLFLQARSLGVGWRYVVLAFSLLALQIAAIFCPYMIFTFSLFAHSWWLSSSPLFSVLKLNPEPQGYEASTLLHHHFSYKYISQTESFVHKTLFTSVIPVKGLSSNIATLGVGLQHRDFNGVHFSVNGL